MSEPNDFDPMDLEPIEASLKEHFAPPSLDALCDRVAEIAAAEDEAGPPPEQLSTRREPPSAGLVLAVVAAAAAVLLVVLGPWSTPSTDEPSAPNELGEAVVANADPPTTSELAGRQLDGFLDRDAMLPGDDGSCAAPAPPEMCDGSSSFPQLLASSSVTQLGECGGLTGRSCSEFDLPADRALLVQLAPSGAKAIVCIEHPWTDPHPMLPASSDYNIFRRELGDYVLYEITPLPTSTALEFVRI